MANSESPHEPGCSFLHLPAELRLQIYTLHFTSIRLASGYRTPSKRIKPALHSLAILHTSRLIYADLQDFWLSHVIFIFETIEDMLDKLASLPEYKLSLIRHVIVSSRSRLPWAPRYQPTPWIKPIWTLRLLPGLCLNTLTFVSVEKAGVAFEMLRSLISQINGWKELRYITHHTGMLQVERSQFLTSKGPWPKRYPTIWHHDFAQRYEKDSGGSMEIYTSTQHSYPGVIVNFNEWDIWEEDLSRLAVIHARGFHEGQPLIRREELGREMLVIVRQGKRANTLKDDWDDAFGWRRTWSQIKSQCEGPGTLERNVEFEYDAYTDPGSFCYQCDD